MSAVKRKAAFRKFHKDNPQVWSMFRGKTSRLVKIGHTKFSQRMIWESIRHDSMQVTTDDKFKLNDHHLIYYAKAYLKKYPEDGEVFSFRPRKKSPSVATIAVTK
jgi:hypothetical protein